LKNRVASTTNNRQRAMAVLHYESYDRLPIVHFGFWGGYTLQKWAAEGHLKMEQADAWTDGNLVDQEVGDLLGFDFNWQCSFAPSTRLWPAFSEELVAEFDDGTRHVRNANGAVVMQKKDAGSIPAEIDHLLKDRASWEEHYKYRYQWSEERATKAQVRTAEGFVRFDAGGLDFLRADERDFPYGLSCGSLFGQIRDALGLENTCYLPVDDPGLFDEIIETVGELCYQSVRFVLEQGARFDFGHFWEDICFKNGPLVNPAVFAAKVGPHYKRITDLLLEHDIDIVSLDCDGDIDTLVPIWLENGVNTMFPIEVGTWNASIAPWRQKYGRSLRGVGGVNKNVFSRDRAAVDGEIERIKPLVELGGYIPCPDHRIAPDAQWDLVRYYCERMRAVFS
jgi:hypothetical protein